MPANLLRRLNIARFERLLLSESGAVKRAMIGQLMAEERLKSSTAYPIGKFS